MNARLQLAIIGCGNMGGAILDGLISAGSPAREQILVIDTSEQVRDRCAERGMSTSSTVRDAGNAERILLAVKPQVFDEVAKELAPLSGPCLVMSVMAGLSSGTIRERLGASARVVRAMPNTPCRIHAGVTAVAAGVGADEPDVVETERILATVGDVVRVEEKDMYAVTAVSGSGPAYVFLLTEAWIAAAVSRGIERGTAERLVRGTLQGAAALVGGGEDPGELRAAVTSKGGTTAAAIAALEARGFRDAVDEAIGAATRRGVELDSEVPS